jgi:hypothetical protein
VGDGGPRIFLAQKDAMSFVRERSCSIVVVCSPPFPMKTLKRFSSFEDLKASESSAEDAMVILRRHRAFKKLMALIRANAVRRSDRPKR